MLLIGAGGAHIVYMSSQVNEQLTALLLYHFAPVDTMPAWSEGAASAGSVISACRGLLLSFNHSDSLRLTARDICICLNNVLTTSWVSGDQSGVRTGCDGLSHTAGVQAA
jgi:hypothetical protein